MSYSDHKSSFLFILLVGFICSFSLPILIIKVYSGLKNNVQVSESTSLPKKRAFFEKSLNLTAGKKRLQIKSSNSLCPSKGEDFLLLSWLRLNDSLREGEQLVVLSKYERKQGTKAGYALALRKENDLIRPVVYWNNEQNEGRWHSFAELEGAEKSWIMYAISFTKGRYLGLHAIRVIDKDTREVELLGGYDLESEIFPHSMANLLIGSAARGEFRGKLGPIGVFSGENLGEDLEAVLNNLKEDPQELPSSLEDANILLWSKDLKKDQSKFAAEMKLVT